MTNGLFPWWFVTSAQMMLRSLPLSGAAAVTTIIISSAIAGAAANDALTVPIFAGIF
jgi:hypothetical protein